MCRVLVGLLLLTPLLGACAAALFVPIAAALYNPSSSRTPDQTDAQFDDQADAQFDDQPYAQFDATLSEMAGANKRQLFGAMGRIPDNSYQLDDQTEVLQWRWDMYYDMPNCEPTSHRGTHWAPRQIMWTGRNSPSRVRESCFVQWTVSKGTGQWYRWEGYACRSVTLAVP
jgi:hypothetical protein